MEFSLLYSHDEVGAPDPAAHAVEVAGEQGQAPFGRGIDLLHGVHTLNNAHRDLRVE